MEAILSSWVTPSAGIACAGLVVLSWVLYRHTVSCRDSRRDLHRKIDDLHKDMSEVSSRISELKGYLSAKSEK